MKTQDPAGRPPSSPSSPLSTIITMRVSRELEEVLREAAEHEAIGLSAFVRTAAKRHAAKVLKEKRRAA